MKNLMMKRVSLWLSLGCWFSASGAFGSTEKPAHAYPDWEKNITGATIVVPEDIVTIEAVPAGTKPLPEGKVELPKAFKDALALNRDGKAAKIKLAPGTYRSVINVYAKEGKGAEGLLVIEGPADRSAVMTGSDDWSDPKIWTQVEGKPGLIEAKWDKEWGDYHVFMENARAGNEAPYLRVHLPDNNQVQLDWAAADGKTEGKWKLYRRMFRKDQSKRYKDGKVHQDNTDFEVVYEGPKHEFTDTKVKKSKTWDVHNYYYRVVQVQPDGTDGPVSNELHVIPGDFSNSARPGVLGRRRELVFVDDKVLRQVETEEDLKPGTYLVDDGFPGKPDDGRLLVMLPKGVELGKANIEVGTREGHHINASQWRIQHKNNLAIRNLTFQRFPMPLATIGALQIEFGKNVLIEDSTFHWNNATGLLIRSCSDLTLRHLEISDNGGAGFLGSGGTNIIMEDIVTNRNNWRGDWGNIHSWAYAGLKTGFGMRDAIFRNITLHDNLTHGFWIDYNTKRLIVDNISSLRNKEYGSFIEALHGPTIIRNSEFSENGRFGVMLANSANGVLHNNIIANNDDSQINLLKRMNRPVSDHDADGSENPGATGSKANSIPRNIEEWTWTDNIVVADAGKWPLVNALPHEKFFSSLQASGNLYHHPRPDASFYIDLLPVGLDDWQLVTGQDLNSQFAEAKLEKDGTKGYRPSDASPSKDRDAWKAIEVSDSGYKNIGKLVAESAKAYNAQAFDQAAKAGPEQWETIDLTASLNHPFDGKQEWARNAVKGIKPGKADYHGVPFDIASHPEWGVSGVALRSNKFFNTPAGNVSRKAKIPLENKKYDRVYILHYLANMGDHRPIAEYSLVYEDGSRHKVELVNFGTGSDDDAQMERFKAAANIQDWWPLWNHFNKDDAKAVMVLDEENPVNSLRYLYTLELENPNPDQPIAGLEFKTLHPNSSASVVVVAATGQKAK